MDEDQAHELYSKFASIDATARQKRVRRISTCLDLVQTSCRCGRWLGRTHENTLSWRIGRGWASTAAAM